VIPPGYRTHAELEHAIARLGGHAIGKTVEGAAMLAVAFGPPVAARATIVLAGLHAIEWIGVETALALCERLAADPPRDRRILVVALANPDGYRAIEADLAAGRRRFRRTNAHGVDLNRNWGTEFLPRPRWLAGFNWPGPAPGSEPEVASILDALDRELAAGARVDTALSLHSFGRWLLLPYGGRWRRSPRYAEHRERALRVQGRLAERYRIAQVSRWMPGAFVYGMEIDELHDRYGACALLVECAFGGQSLAEPARWLEPFYWYNPRRPSLVASDLARALDPFVRGA
jgi:predicted deacylase